MKNMKIRTTSPEHSAKVQAALFALGFMWDSAKAVQTVQHDEKTHLYAYWNVSRGHLTHSDAATDGGYFERHDNVEYVLVGAALVPADSLAAAVVEPPLGLRPRYIVDGLRIQEILSACTRYTVEAQTIPAEWLVELAELNARAK